MVSRNVNCNIVPNNSVLAGLRSTMRLSPIPLLKRFNHLLSIFKLPYTAAKRVKFLLLNPFSTAQWYSWSKTSLELEKWLSLLIDFGQGNLWALILIWIKIVLFRVSHLGINSGKMHIEALHALLCRVPLCLRLLTTWNRDGTEWSLKCLWWVGLYWGFVTNFEIYSITNIHV